MLNFQNITALCSWLSFDLTKIKVSKKKEFFFWNSISSFPGKCVRANLAPIFVNFCTSSKFELIIWFWVIILYIILHFLFGGALRKIFLQKCFNFEIHIGRYLDKNSKKQPKNNNFSIYLANSKCFSIPKMCWSVEQVWCSIRLWQRCLLACLFWLMNG